VAGVRLKRVPPKEITRPSSRRTAAYDVMPDGRLVVRDQLPVAGSVGLYSEDAGA
jgi:hypothetical protein